MPPSPTVESFWQAYLLTLPPGAQPPQRFDSWHFCDNQPDADALVELVLRGIKRATCGMLWAYEAEGEALPQVGDLSVVTDWQGSPRCVIRLTEVEVKPYNAVSADFAAAEGEGDRSLAYWRQAHWQAFSRECAEISQTPSEDMPLVCQRFEVVYP